MIFDRADGGIAGTSASTSVPLTVNAPPSITAPTTGSLVQNGSLVFSTVNGNSISITDAAAGTDSLSLSVAQGTLFLGSTAGLIFTSGANGTSSFTVKGTVTRLNAALNGLAYQPLSGYAGSDTLLIQVADPGDNLSAQATVSRTVNAPPTITARPRNSGRRSTSTAAMNWSRSTCRTQLVTS